MAKKKTENQKVLDLRKKAEEKLKSVRKGLEDMSVMDVAKLVHELQVHQIELEMQNDELKKTHHDLRVSKNLVEKVQKKYYNLFGFAPVGYLILTKDGVIKEVNHAAADMLGSGQKSLVKAKLYSFIAGEYRDSFFIHLRKAFETKEKQTCEIEMLRNDSGHVPVLVESIVFENDDDQYPVCSTVLTDITEIKNYEEQIQADLHEKEVLLGEVHHRVKNNFQLIMSILRLQENQLKDAALSEIFRVPINRIRVMAEIHEKLYQSKNLTDIYFKEFVQTTVKNIILSYSSDTQRIETAFDVDENIKIAVTRAIPCGMIINELVSNSFKYAFPDDYKGEGSITISLNEGCDHVIKMIVMDNGVGMSPGFDINQSDSLGLKLVTEFVKQLKGEYSINCKNGTEHNITFIND